MAQQVSIVETATEGVDMSHKYTEDRTRPSFPWTARQRRMRASNRKSRKMDRKMLRFLHAQPAKRKFVGVHGV